jgi:hypothetical protein
MSQNVFPVENVVNIIALETEKSRRVTLLRPVCVGNSPCNGTVSYIKFDKFTFSIHHTSVAIRPRFRVYIRMLSERVRVLSSRNAQIANHQIFKICLLNCAIWNFLHSLFRLRALSADIFSWANFFSRLVILM